eukprot:GCRY01002994.1.p1 GENE.GCRY01002994.1~~GCRY01002994.1.p1  ORF type:complete len:694 (+),score=204.63 GCRY01002994.1:67-2148(+)
MCGEEVCNKVEKMSIQDKKPKKGAAPLEFAEKYNERLAKWETLKKASDQRLAALKHEPIKVTLPDGTVKEGLSYETTPLSIAESISAGLAQSAVVAKLNDDTLWDMTRPLEGDCALQFLKFSDPEAQHVFWHSSAHLLGQSMELFYPEGQLTIGPAVEEGFYYDIYLADKSVSSDHFATLESNVNKFIKQKQPFERLVLTKEEAKDLFKDNVFKQRILDSKVADGETCTAYRCGHLIDLCRGPHIPTSSKLKAFKITKNSSSYWLSNADNEALQRIYAISFDSKDAFKEWKEFQAQALARDHRNIGKQQELWYFHPLSPGSAFMLPHGTRIYNKVKEFMREEYWKRGYEEVITPNVFNKALWETSGHWGKYQENMFTFECEKQEYGMKPMNCPGHCLLFDHRQRSYKELPFRVAEFGVLHRNELSGTLTGLTRVRRFVQDDAHIFCRMDQVLSEVNGVLDFIKHVYGVFGFTFTLELSTRPDNFLGEVALWDKAEAHLQAALEAWGMPWKLNPGDGAFYGPKIDIHVIDAMRRSHQCATCQLDFTLPARFELKYTTEGTVMDRPVMIHRAIFGSIERFLAMLTEHLAGKWPFWVSPRQLIVLPISEHFNEYAKEVRDMLWQKKYFVDADLTNKKLPKKVREAQVAQYNYILVVGKEEETNRSVNIRMRDSDKTRVASLDELCQELREKTENHQ